MNLTIKILSLIFVILLGSIVVYLMLRQIQIRSWPLTSYQKIRKSFLFGMLLSVCALLFLGVFQIFLWDKIGPQINLKSLLTLIGCIVLPIQAIGTIGAYIQLTYLEFLAKRVNKKNLRDS